MRILHAANVNDAFATAVHSLAAGDEGLFTCTEMTRNGRVRSAPEPVVTVYHRPWERVLFSPVRDANPFFHLAEALWMLAGRNDVAFPARFAGQMKMYSDDEVRLNGAYGYRWRNHFEVDQLSALVDLLRNEPETRRAVLTMWDGHTDLSSAPATGSKDVPCNTHVYFRLLGSVLQMTVLCRSNDLFWGAYGANAVHFSVLQEWVAAAVCATMGPMYQVSNNLHAYIERPDVLRILEGAKTFDLNANHYLAASAAPVPLLGDDESAFDFLVDCLNLVVFAPADWCSWLTPVLRTVFAREVAVPMFRAHALHKSGRTEEAFESLRDTQHIDWHFAGFQWLERRLAAKGAPL